MWCLGNGLPPTGARVPIGATKLIFEKSTGSRLKRESLEHLLAEETDVITGIGVLVGVAVAEGDDSFGVGVAEGDDSFGEGWLCFTLPVVFQNNLFPTFLQTKLSPVCTRLDPTFLQV